jgi:hypothetical protein
LKISEEIRTLICDDIRNEVGGKTSLMGVYEDIIVPQIPAVLLKLSFSVFLKKIKRDLYNFRSYIKMPNDKTIEVMSQNFPRGQAVKGKSVNINLIVSPFVIEKAGSANWEIIFNDDNVPGVVHTFELKSTK